MTTQSTPVTRATQIIQQQTQINLELAHQDRHVPAQEVAQLAKQVAQVHLNTK